MSETNGAVRPRKPQLADSIEKMDEMIEHLNTAIPGAVADEVREALGPAFAAALKEAVKAAMVEALKELGPAVAQAVAQPPNPPTQPQAARKPAAGAWARVKTVMDRLRRWGGRALAPVAAHTALGWAIAKCVGASTIRSRVAAIVTALSGAAAALLGLALGPVGAAALLALVSGSATAAAVWAAPTARLFVALRDE